MVGKIVVDGDAVHGAAHLHAPFHILETGQAFNGLGGRHADMARRGDGGQRIHAVVVALQRPAHPALNLPVEHDVEAVVIAKIGNGPACAVFRTEKLGFRPASACKYTLQAVFPAVDQQAALTGNGAHEMVELRLDSGKIGKDVRVIELEIVQNGRTGT